MLKISRKPNRESIVGCKPLHCVNEREGEKNDTSSSHDCDGAIDEWERPWQVFLIWVDSGL